jgi:hypothetical protein
MTKRTKFDAAVKALMSDPDGMSPNYIDSLLDGFERHRANHARDLATWIKDQDTAIYGDAPPPFPEKLLHKFLEYTSHDIKDVLLDQMETEDSKRAAVLFLYGHAHGFWNATAGEIAEARELNADAACEADDEATRYHELRAAVMSSAVWKAAHIRVERRDADKSRKAEFAHIAEALAAAKSMKAIVADPMASDADRLFAVRDFFAVLIANGKAALLVE